MRSCDIAQWPTKSDYSRCDSRQVRVSMVMLFDAVYVYVCGLCFYRLYERILGDDDDNTPNYRASH